jgi:hypothetical protein
MPKTMTGDELVAKLKHDRDILTNLIDYLEGRLLPAVNMLPKTQGSPQSHASAKVSTKAQPKRHGRTWTPQMRAQMSKRLKQVIAAKKKAAEARSKVAKKAAAARKPKVAAKASA